MTKEEAIQILDPETSREALLPYAYDQPRRLAMVTEAMRMGAEALRKPEGIPVTPNTLPEYVKKSVLYEKIAGLEERARQRFLDTPWDSPVIMRYQTQLNERTAFKHMIADEPAADVVPVVHGRWVREVYTDPQGGEWTKYRCSLCGRIEIKQEPYYNCGAKMDQEHEPEPQTTLACAGAPSDNAID